MNTITFDLETYTHQIDYSGYVSNLTFVQWMEIAQQRLLEGVALPIYQLQEHGMVLMLVQTEIQYWRSLRLGESVRVELCLTALQSASITIKIAFYNVNAHVIAEGSRQELFIDPKTRRPKQLTPEIRSYFLPYLKPEPF
jgi:acyl-CoA thioester hydrolase